MKWKPIGQRNVFSDGILIFTFGESMIVLLCRFISRKDAKIESSQRPEWPSWQQHVTSGISNRSRIFLYPQRTIIISRPVGTMEFSPGQHPGNGNWRKNTTSRRGSGIIPMCIVSFSIALSGRIDCRCGLCFPGRCPGLNYTAPCGAIL